MTELISKREHTRQQLISSTPSPIGGSMTTDNTAVTAAEVDVPKQSLADFIVGTAFVNFSPRVTVTISPFVSESVPDEVKLSDGNLYSVASPLRKAAEGKAAGILRKPLADVFQTVRELFSGDLRFFGDVETIADQLSAISASVEETLMVTFAQANGGETAFFVPAADAPAPELPESLETEEEEFDGDEPAAPEVDTEGLVEVSFHDFVNVFVYGSLQENGTIVLTININLLAPLFANAADIAKNLASVNNIVKNLAANTVGVENATVLYVLDTSTLLAPNTVKLLSDVSAEENDVSSVGIPYLRNAVEAGEDPFGLYPIEHNLTDAIESLFAYGGDALLVVNNIVAKK